MLDTATRAISDVFDALNESSSSLSLSSSSSNSSFFHGGNERYEPADWEKYGGFLVYFALMCYVFCGFEIICDAFFVPALNVFCELMHMSEDFAGATLMGIGGNLPDIFSAIVGVCIVGSDVGTGTVVGSLLFNHLCIIGFSVLFVKYILLDLKCLIREVSFYALAIIMLFLALRDSKITIYESTSFLVVYVIYFLLFSKCCGRKKKYTKIISGSINDDVGDYKAVSPDQYSSVSDIESQDTRSFTDYPTSPQSQASIVSYDESSILPPSSTTSALRNSISIDSAEPSTDAAITASPASVTSYIVPNIASNNEFAIASPASLTSPFVANSNDFTITSPASVTLHFAHTKAAADDVTSNSSSSSSSSSTVAAAAAAAAPTGDIQINNSMNDVTAIIQESDEDEEEEEGGDATTEPISVPSSEDNPVSASLPPSFSSASDVPVTSSITSSIASSVPAHGNLPKRAGTETPKETKRFNKEKLVKAHSHVFNSIMEIAKSGSNGDETVESGTRVGLPYGEVQMHGFLYKKSRWYTKVSISSQMWQRRWFVLGETLWYCRNPLYPEKKRREIPLWKAWKVKLSKADPCTIEIYTRKQTYVLRASDEDNAKRWARALKGRVKTTKEMHPELYGEAGLVDVDEDDEDESLLEFPYGASAGHIFFWAITLPYALLFTFTIPDVKKEKCKRMFPLTFIMVLIWLAILSYAMISGASMFAKILNIPEDIMGVSITAIGASLPSLFGSVIAARQGSAKMAISNAFGANLCSILLAFGLPCFFYSTFFHPGEAYPCDSGAIFITVIVLFAALVVFLIIAAAWKLRLNYVHGIVFILLYVVLLTFVILSQVFSIGVKK